VLTVRKPAASIALRAVLLVLGLGAAACTGARPAPPAAPLKPLRAASLDEVLAAYDAYCESGTTLSASGDLDVRDRRTGKGRTLGVRVVAARGGRLYLKGSVTVVTAVEVASNGERFWFQVPSKKTVWTGAATAAAREAGTEDAPYQALRPSDVTSALLPEPLAPAPGDTVVLDADRESFTLTLAAPAAAERAIARRRVSLDRDTLRPVRLRRYDARGDLETDVSLSAWTAGLPRQVDIRRPLDGYEAAFRFDKVERNVPVPERAFAPRTPEGYAVVEVR
jgi:outer membrane lipoprotein-sorting protein